MHWIVGWLSLAVGLLLPGAAMAQQSLRFDLQPFHLATTTGGLVNVETPAIGAHLKPRATFQLSYQKDPLIYDVFGQRTEGVSNRLGGDLTVSMGLFRWAELGVGLPVTFYQNGSPTVQGAPTFAQTAIGDVRIVPKVRVWGQPYSGFSAAVLAEVVLPTAADDALSGAGLSGMPQLLLRYAFSRASVNFALGYRIAPKRRLFGLTVDDQLTYALASEIRIIPKLSALVELTGATAGQDPFSRREQSPLIATAAVRYRLGQFLISAGGGPGLVAGAGAAQAHFFASLGFDFGGTDSDGDNIPDHQDACPVAPEDVDGYQDADGCPDYDNDSDGIADAQDKCPLVKEDIDQFEDTDGCPDLDNDGDGLADSQDECPKRPEDHDGYKDKDGCPDPDNDYDNIADKDDKCPNKAELVNGIEDDDGCPEDDIDGDGVLNAKDACPNTPEDKNGIQDDDGCPEDPDGDRIVGKKDKCPNEPETKNGYQDDDGCPDDPSPKVKIKGGTLWLSESVYFESDSWDIKPRFRRILRKVAQLIIKNKRIRIVWVEGHTDLRGGVKYNQWLSFKRAKNVVRYLRRQGVKRTRLRAVGWGIMQSTGDAAKDRKTQFHIDNKEPPDRSKRRRRRRRRKSSKGARK